jgi:ketol-acid reductoisomerase
MSSRNATRALRAALKQASRPAVQQRTFLTAVNASRQTAAKAMPKATVAAQQVRGVKTVDFAGHKEKVFGTWAAT